LQRADKELTTAKEDSLDLSEIYPSRVGEVSAVKVEDEDENFYDIVDSSIPSTLDFNDYLIDGETMTIIFQTGMLAGREFEVKYIHKAKSVYGVQKEARRFEIVPAENDGITMPGGVYVPAVGDKYAVFGIQLPDDYICNNTTKTGASWDMLREAVKYLYEHEDKEFTFSGTLDSIWAKRRWNDIGNKIVVGGYILFSDPQFMPDGSKIRITGVKRYVNNPYKPEIELSNTTVGGSITSELNKASRNEVTIEESQREAIAYTKRRFRDAKETMEMLENSMLNFSGSVNPIAVQTMQLLVGDESLQFRFVNSMTNPTAVNHSITYDANSRVLTVPSGIIQHMTLGITNITSSHKASDYKYWQLSSYVSPALNDPDVSYYLYAKVSKTGTSGSFVLRDTAITMNQVEGYYHLLVGILNSEYDGERSLATLYGYTEVLPGRITTDKVISSDGESYLDLLNSAMQLSDKLQYNTDGKGSLYVKGRIAVESTIGDKTVDDYVDDISGKKADAVKTELNTKITELDYIKQSLAQGTTVDGGLILSSLLRLGTENNDFTTQKTWAGLSGLYDTTKTGNGIAFWAGGGQIDKWDYYDKYYDKTTGTWKDLPEDVRAAAAVDRMDGSGYRANGNLWWDTKGEVHADPLSFFVGPTHVGKLLAAFNVTDDTIYPQLPFGDTSFQGVDGIKIGDGYLKWDSERNALYVVGKDNDGNEQAINFYTHGEVIAGGGDSDDDGGGNVSFNLLTSWTQGYDTTYALGAALAIELHNSLNTLSTKVGEIETNMGVGVSVNNGQVVTPNDKGVINLTIDEYTPTAATSGALGCIKIGYTTSATNRNYAVKLDSDKAYVNVPWIEYAAGTGLSLDSSSHKFSLNTASSTEVGGIKTGYSASGKNYPVQLSDGKAYVNVPWIEYAAGTGLSLDSSNHKFSIKSSLTFADGTTYDGESAVTVNAAKVGALATDGTAEAAKKLSTKRKLWGQEFNGESDVSGALSSVTTISASGNITTSGEVTAGSDIRYKDIQHDCSLPLPFIANAPLFNFKWKSERDDGREHIGTSAQYWQEYAPEFVSGDEDFLRLNYGALGVAMGISNARAIQSVHEQVIGLVKSLQRLTEENKRLSDELELIRKGGQQ
jgi:hypothetical protein